MLTPVVDRDLNRDLLTAKQVARRLSVSVRTLWRMLRRGTLPEPIRYNRKLVRWRSVDLERYLDALMPSQSHAAPPAA